MAAASSSNALRIRTPVDTSSLTRSPQPLTHRMSVRRNGDYKSSCLLITIYQSPKHPAGNSKPPPRPRVIVKRPGERRQSLRQLISDICLTRQLLTGRITPDGSQESLSPAGKEAAPAAARTDGVQHSAVDG